MSIKDAEIKSIKKSLDDDKKKVIFYMNKTGKESIKSDFGSVYSIVKINIEYDAKAIMKCLSKEYTDEIIKKSYSVDISKLKQLFKKYDVPLEKLKEVVSIERTVDEVKLNKLYDSGEISLEDLDGCFKTHETKSYGFRFK